MEEELENRTNPNQQEPMENNEYWTNKLGGVSAEHLGGSRRERTRE
jgi:hypothetical protein